MDRDDLLRLVIDGAGSELQELVDQGAAVERFDLGRVVSKKHRFLEAPVNLHEIARQLHLALERKPIARASEHMAITLRVESQSDIRDLLRDLLVMPWLERPLARVLVLVEMALAVGGNVPAKALALIEQERHREELHVSFRRGRRRKLM